jgi:hypothetical protein
MGLGPYGAGLAGNPKPEIRNPKEGGTEDRSSNQAEAIFEAIEEERRAKAAWCLQTTT